MAMASALATQLAAQAARPQGPLKGRASLLLSARDAGHADTDSVHADAMRGLDTLCGMDSRFFAYQTTLFGEGAKRTDRDSLEPEEAARLAETISSFLCLLPAYILLRPAHLTLEFLIKRFQ